MQYHAVPYPIRLVPMPGESIRKQTHRNLEYNLSVLIMLLNLLAKDWSQEVVSAISVMFVQISIDVEHSPTNLIADLKAARGHFIGWVRAATGTTSRTDLTAIGEEKGWNRYAMDSIVLYERLMGGLPLENKIHFIAVLDSFLSLHRVIITVANPSYGTITQEGTYVGDTSLETDAAAALSSLGITKDGFLKILSSKTSGWRYILSNKGGPNGKAVMSARQDAIALARNEKVFGALTAFVEHLRMGSLINDLMATVNIPGAASTSDNEVVLGRLHPVEEWGGKTRVVAILDYWTQVALDPLHRALSEVLKGITMDGTANQLEAVSRVKAFTAAPGAEVYSFDLTAATDRLPISFQQKILGLLFGNEHVATNWRNLLTEREFIAQDGKAYKYAVGQPMGAKSSFPMLALTHHVIIQIAAKRAGIEGVYSDYAIVGDDVTLVGEGVARRYREIIKTLGVGVSESKSFIHDSKMLPVGELCKRTFISGYEITALPSKLISKVGVSAGNVVDFQETLVSRGFFSDPKQAVMACSAMVDQETARRLLVLNSLPGSVTGLHNPVGAFVEELQLVNMYDGAIVSERDIEEAYLYTAVVEQIKRLDALLRETEVVSRAVHEQAGTRLALVQLQTFTEKFNKRREQIKKDLPALGPLHPLVKAVGQELNRIGQLLSSLRGGYTSLGALAKLQILDAFRNPVVDVINPVLDRGDRVPAFTLLNKALSQLDTMILDKGGTKLEFSLMLMSVQRHYTVTWIRGQGVFVNAVRAKVEQAIGTIETNIANWAKTVCISPRRDRTVGKALRDTLKPQRG